MKAEFDGSKSNPDPEPIIISSIKKNLKLVHIPTAADNLSRLQQIIF